MLIGLIAGLIGLALGVPSECLPTGSARSSGTCWISTPMNSALPAGAAEVLAVVGRAFVVVDAVDGVVRASPAAYAYGLVRGHTVVHKELLDMTAGVRRDGVILERQLELPRGPLGHGTIIVQVRAAMLGEEYILLLADDRTEITRTEEIRNDFVANVSHELKTPVGAISLLAEAWSPRLTTKKRCAGSPSACTRSPAASLPWCRTSSNCPGSRVPALRRRAAPSTSTR
jgi:two-component system sensor histidine kinase SenX3